MPERVPPSERTKEALRQLFTEGTDGDVKSELVRLSIRQIIEQALEAATRDLLGRDYYARRTDERAGSRNGYRSGHIDTAEGEVPYAVPQVRDVDARVLSAIRQQLRGRTENLEKLALEMYARGCSTRDIEAIFRTEGGDALLSRTAVSEVTEALWAEYEDFATRDLSDVQPLYLFLDGIAERLRPGAKREAILCAWTITWEGKKLLLQVTPGTKESTECCKELLADLKRRGLADPVEIVTDGAPGLIRAVEESFPASLRQRCLAHKMRNILAKVPREHAAEMRQLVHAIYEAPSLAMARTLRSDFVDRYENLYPSAVQCFEEDFDACIAHLYCPPAHRKVIRTTNLLERLFVEERRRVKAALHLFGERPVLKLMYAALVRGAENWRGIQVTDFERRQLEKLQQELRTRHLAENQPVVKSTEKNPTRIYSKNRT
jgi:putative transposase